MFTLNKEYFHIVPQTLIHHYWIKHFVQKKLTTLEVGQGIASFIGKLTEQEAKENE